MHEHPEEIISTQDRGPQAPEAQNSDTLGLIENFRNRRIDALSGKVTKGTEKPASDLNGKEILHIRRVLEKNKGVRHQTADELDCPISWLDQVIAFHKLEK